MKSGVGSTRRGFLQGAAAMAAGVGLRGAEAGTRLVYAATYSSPKGPEGSVGRGSGIVLYEMDRASGRLRQREVFENGNNPSWLALDAAREHLYTANETDEYEGTASGSVSSFAVEKGTGKIRLVNTLSSEGAGPAHISLHPAGRYVLVANYAGGTVAVLPIGAGGELGKATDVHHDVGTVGPKRAASAPEGSMAISGHDKPHAHMIQADATGRWVLSADLGMDKILVWKFDAERGKLEANEPAWAELPPGDGPRHFLFHPNGRWVYSLQEEGSTMVLWDWDGKLGRLKARQTASTLPKAFKGTNFTSELALGPDGQFLYVANRLHDTIAWFRIGAGGEMKWAGEEWTRGDYPRSFTIDPEGRFLYSCNQRGDAITTFRIRKETGALEFTGEYTAAGTPAALVFLS